jgi:hypothetical protein
MSKEKQRVVAYPADTMDSLETLEFTCERDESRLTSQIMELQLGKIEDDENRKATAATYERTDEIQVGHLAFEQYETEVDISSLQAIHNTRGDTFLFKGDAYIDNSAVKVLVFREPEQ